MKREKKNFLRLFLPTERGVSKKVKRFMSSQTSWELLREALLLFQGNNPGEDHSKYEFNKGKSPVKTPE